MNAFSSINTRIGKYIDSVADIQALRAYHPSHLKDGDTVIVAFKATLGDQQGGVFVWAENNLNSDDGDTCIRPNVAISSGRWVRIFGKGDVGPQGQSITGPQGVPGPTGPVGSVGPAGDVENVSRVPAPTSSATPALGPTGVLNGTTSYRVTFVTAVGETEGSIASSVVSPVNQQVTLMSLPVSASAKVIARNVYRTPVDETNSELCRFVGTVANNTDTSFSDNVPDSSLGARLPWFNSTGGNIKINGAPYLTTGFAVSLGQSNQPAPGNYATVSVGVNVMPKATAVLRSEAIGIDALQNIVSGQGLTAIGTHAGGELTSAIDCIIIGYGALQTATGAASCVAIGRGAASNATGTAQAITAVGAYSLQLLTTGSNNTALGLYSGYGCTTGILNTLVGVQAGQYIAGGNFNTFLGAAAGANVTGSGNTAIGHNTLSQALDVGGNVVIGQNAGGSITTGSNNTFVGVNSGNGASQKVDANTSTAIGYGAVTTRNSEIVIGNASNTEFVVIAGVSFSLSQIAALKALVASS